MESISQILNPFRTVEFVAPSGYKYTLREQNGHDDDVLSNPLDAENLVNISKFISGIIVNTDFNEIGKLTPDQVHNDMPALDRYAILIKSRIFSLGSNFEFEYNWGEKLGKFAYSQDLEEFLFEYDKEPSQEILESKPNAIPYYPGGKKLKDIEFTISSGKTLRFDIATPKSEVYLINLPLDRRTKNQELISRNLRLLVEGKWEKVTNFSSFSVKDMVEIRKEISSLDPVFMGNTEITHPKDPSLTRELSILAIPDFFFPQGI